MFIDLQKVWILLIFVMLVVILVAVLVFIPSRVVETVDSMEFIPSSELSGTYTSPTDPFDTNVNEFEKTSHYDSEDESEEGRWLKDSGDVRPAFMPRSFGSVDKWSKLIVTWKFNCTSHNEPDRVRNVLREAAARWSSVTPLTLVETNDSKPDIEISFLRTSDVRPGTDINGKGGPYLSHSTGPNSPKCYIHFNAIANWDFNLNKCNQSNARQLLRSAMFGFGITLGLAQTSNENSVLNADTNLTVLQENDIKRVQKLYCVESDATKELSGITDGSSKSFDVLNPYPQTSIHKTSDETSILQNIIQIRRPRLPARLGASLSNPKIDINIQNIVIL